MKSLALIYITAAIVGFTGVGHINSQINAMAAEFKVRQTMPSDIQAVNTRINRFTDTNIQPAGKVMQSDVVYVQSNPDDVELQPALGYLSLQDTNTFHFISQ